METRVGIWFSLGLAAVVLLAAITGVVIVDSTPDPRPTDASLEPTTAPYPFFDEDSGSEHDGNGSNDDANDSVTTDDGTTGERGDASNDASTTELSDLEFQDAAGLAALIAIVLGTLFLIRRAPR